MDQVAQSTVIAAVSNRALERRIRALTKQAPRFPGADVALLCCKRLSANTAVRPLEWPQRNQTAFANGKPGNFDQRGTTDTAIGGKKSEE